MPTSLLRLLVDPASGITDELADRAYMTGLDQTPWSCRTRLNNGEILVERNVSDSGRFVIPFPVAAVGEMTLSTGTLMHRERPYRLEIELARGKLNQARNQLAEWQAAGLTVPAPVDAALRDALQEFAAAVTMPEDPVAAAESARRAISKAIAAGELLVDAYVEQALNMRHRQNGQLPTLLGTKLGHKPVTASASPHLAAAFNSTTVSLLWREIEATEGAFHWDAYDRQIEWCKEKNLHVTAGPLLRLDNRGMPDWLTIWEGDFDGLVSFASDFIATAVRRYRGKVDLWQCAARVNGTDVLGLQEDQKLQLAVRALEVTRSIDPDTPAIIRFDQPWGEYLRRSEFELSPLHFADALVRAGLQMGGIGLEINLGYAPGGSAARDRLDFNRLIDLWSLLGLPLHVSLALPSSSEPDAKAVSSAQITDAAMSWTPERQNDWIKRYVPLLLAKGFVHSVTWSQLSDSEPHEFPHAGLFDAAGMAKPAFTALAGIRKKHLR